MRSIFGCSWATVAKFGSSLKPNHHHKVVYIPDTLCTYLSWKMFVSTVLEEEVDIVALDI